MHQERCLCEHLPTFRLATRLCLVMHCRETTKTTATGPLALATLENSELFVHGLPHEPLDLEHLHDQGREVCVLFPSDDARELDSEFVREMARPITLVVPDGNWRQATRVPRRIPGLDRARRVTLPHGPETRWGVRRETRDGGLATFEAIARAFGILEGAPIEQAMMEFFDRMVKSTFETRGYDREGNPMRPVLSRTPSVVERSEP